MTIFRFVKTTTRRRRKKKNSLVGKLKHCTPQSNGLSRQKTKYKMKWDFKNVWVWIDIGTIFIIRLCPTNERILNKRASCCCCCCCQTDWNTTCKIANIYYYLRASVSGVAVWIEQQWYVIVTACLQTVKRYLKSREKPNHPITYEKFKQ